jgi:predicted RNA-binding protein with PUA-like domain
MARWLLKTEPSEYSFADLQRDKKATWDGIKNPTALKNIRSMKKGDLAFVYHTGGERAIIGIAEISSDAKNDAVQIKAKKVLANPVTLETIKQDKTFAGWDLLRIGRLSVVPVSDPIWKRVEELSTKASS